MIVRGGRGLNVCIVTTGHIGSNPRAVKEAGLSAAEVPLARMAAEIAAWL